MTPSENERGAAGSSRLSSRVMGGIAVAGTGDSSRPMIPTGAAAGHSRPLMVAAAKKSFAERSASLRLRPLEC